MLEYTDVINTDVAWLPQIPAHWQLQKIDALFTERKTKVSDKDYAPLSVTKKGILPQLEHAAKSNDSDNHKLVKAGDFVINSRSDRKGSCGVSKLDGSVSLINLVLTPRSKLNNDYVHYLLRNYRFSEEYYRNGRGIVADLWTTRYSEMRTILLPVPPRAEQDQIVRFLDWKVSEINKLIGIRRQEISLIRQYRELRITERLKGKKVWLKRLLKSPLQYGANSSGTDFSSDLPRYIRITDIDSDGNLKQDGAKSIFEEDAAPYILEDGDILLARSGATVGKAFLYKKCYGLSAYAGYLIRAKFDNSRILPEYFMYFTNSSTYLDWKNSVFIQATIQNISAEKYGYLPIPLPSIDEQKRIVNELDLICKYMDSLVEIKYKEIHALQELKAVIISDVVTGKIDVRNVTIPEYEHVDDISDDDNEDGEDREDREETENDGEEA